jgi:hypothetical protein
MIKIREKQGQVLEELYMLEERILCQLLPPTYNCVDNDLPLPNLELPTMNDNKRVELINTHKKMIQQWKRTMLHNDMKKYEMTIQDYENQYKKEFVIFEQISSKDLVDWITNDMIRRMEKMLRDINSNMTGFRIRLLRRLRRSSSAKKTIGVSPQVIIDTLKVPLNTAELAYLSRGNKDNI